jgi:ABC-2 type transport system permease protein
MTLLNTERIKLFTTRSPYWCLLAVVLAAVGFALIFGLSENGRNATPSLSVTGLQIGLAVYMVLAALAVTTEYRFSTIRTTFLAVPKRTRVLVAKTVLLAVLGGVIGLVLSLVAFWLTAALAASPASPMELSSGEDWRVVAGHGALYAIAAVIAVAVGTIVRQSAGAIAIVLLWPFLLENLVTLIPTVGPKVQPWLPFSAANRFTSPSDGFNSLLGSSGPTPLQGLLVFAAAAAVLWVIALITLQRRDA